MSVTRVWNEVQEVYIQNHFDRFGEVTNIQMNLGGRITAPKGFAFIEYKNHEEVQLAMQQMNEVDLGIGTWR